MDLILFYAQRRHVMKSALKSVYVKCPDCEGLGFIASHAEILNFAERAGVVAPRSFGRSFFDFMRSACPKCDSSGTVLAADADLPHEVQLQVLAVYNKNRNRKVRQKKALLTNKTWLSKSNYNDPRYK